MKIAVDKTSNIVLVASPEMSFDGGLTMPRLKMLHRTEANTDIVDNITLPANYVDGGYTYSAGVFTAIEVGISAANESIKKQIVAKESEITPRRIREAVLGTDAGWLSAKEAEIAALRAQLV